MKIVNGQKQDAHIDGIRSIPIDNGRKVVNIFVDAANKIIVQYEDET